ASRPSFAVSFPTRVFLYSSARRLSSPPLPYTTLFRSPYARQRRAGQDRKLIEHEYLATVRESQRGRPGGEGCRCMHRDLCRDGRWEEHTSELQSRENLVCRLLLEKKKETAHALRNATR